MALLCRLTQASSSGLNYPIKDGDTIAFLGDSITAGGENHGGYCRLVMHGLRTKGIHVKGIFAGVPGEKSLDMLLRLNGILLRKPEHLFLLAGVNDVWMTDPTAKIGVFKPSPGMGTELEHYKTYISEILDRCKSAGVKVITSTCTPIMEDPEYRLNKKAVGYNAFLRFQAKERVLPIARLNQAFFERIAEIKATLPTDDNRMVLTSDGVHPFSKGNQVMALGILKAFGFTDSDLVSLEKQWMHSPQILVIGGRQVRSSTRYTGWMTMLLDVLNNGKDMVKSTHIMTKSETTNKLVRRFIQSPSNERMKSLLFIPPMADLHRSTPPDEFKESLQRLIDEAKKRTLKVVISTYAMVGPDPSSKLNASATPYNAIIRDIVKENHVLLSDIASAMQGYFSKHPKAELNLEDERFNYPGSLLMVETLGKALKVDSTYMERQHKIWSKARCYTFRYSDSTTFNLSLSKEGAQVLDDISRRFHKLSRGKILDFGIDLLLNDKSEANRKRLELSKGWGILSDDSKELSFRKYPHSDAEKRVFEAYTTREDISYPTFYSRAFLVGLYALRKEDPLNRGSF
jgi:lysophospholipase L1-like esterase